MYSFNQLSPTKRTIPCLSLVLQLALKVFPKVQAYDFHQYDEKPTNKVYKQNVKFTCDQYNNY